MLMLYVLFTIDYCGENHARVFGYFAIEMYTVFSLQSLSHSQDENYFAIEELNN